MGRTFPAWAKLAFAESGNYKPYDLNMPSTVPPRSNFHDFAFDSPLTELGTITCTMVGRTMRMSSQMATQIYSSPALSCVQSAHGRILTFYNLQ